MSEPPLYLGDWPDVEANLLDWARTTFPELADPDPQHPYEHVGVETPSDLQSRLPFARIYSPPGGINDFDDITDRVLVDVDIFTATRNPGRELAMLLRGRLVTYPMQVGAIVLDSVQCNMRPARLPWADETLYRHGATYTVSLRR